MAELDIASVAVAGLEVFANSCDVRRDLHCFVQFVGDNEVKRIYRGNELPKAVIGRLAKLFSDPTGAAAVAAGKGWPWLACVDRLALLLGFVQYDTEGVYQGYTSSERTFPDNFMEQHVGRHAAFLGQTLVAQEQALLAALADDADHSRNEFHDPGPLGRLDQFGRAGTMTGVLPQLRFGQVRRHLLRTLAQCPPGPWFSVAGLVGYLKREDPFFLIPKSPLPERRAAAARRYGNFVEGKRGEWGRGSAIPDFDPLGFEKVEGRYVERFLEGIPLTMGYVEVAYGEADDATVTPSRGRLKAFRVTPRLAAAVRGTIPEPEVTVLPNFELHVASEFHPAGVLERLLRVAEVTTVGNHTVLRLNPGKVAAAAAAAEALDAVGMLRGLALRGIPANVERELQGWIGRADVFTVYTGFGILEADSEHPAAQPFVVEPVGPGLALVRTPAKLFGRLETAELAPRLVSHPAATLKALAAGTPSRLATQASAPRAKRAERRAVTISRQVRTTLRFPDNATFEIVRKALLDNQCVLPSDPKAGCARNPRGQRSEVRGQAKPLHMIAACDHLGRVRL